MFLSGCTSLRTTPLPGAPGQTPAIRLGDDVRVQTKTGQTSNFKVTAVEPDALAGTGVRIKYDDMAGLQVRQLDALKTTLLVVGVVAVAVVGAGMASGFGGPILPAGTFAGLTL